MASSSLLMFVTQTPWQDISKAAKLLKFPVSDKKSPILYKFT